MLAAFYQRLWGFELLVSGSFYEAEVLREKIKEEKFLLYLSLKKEPS